MAVYDAVILGAGFGGLCTAIQLQRAGFENLVILEKDADIGGTWFRNAYPGCACDVPSQLYWPSYVRQPDWSRTFASRDEILANIKRMAEDEDVAQFVRLNRDVVTAVWQETAGRWRVETRDHEVYESPIFVCAAGQLSQPKSPAILGLDTFSGSTIHSSRWPETASIEGKRVAVVGTGASAIQLVPSLAKTAKEVKVFQRSAPYVMPKGDKVLSDDERSAFRERPAQFRSEMMTGLSGILAALVPGSAASVGVRAAFEQNLAAQVEDRALRDRLRPSDEFGCKRPLLSDEYYQAFSRSNVSLVTDSIACAEPEGLRTDDGSLHAVDIIVLATGFHATEFLKGIDVRGRGGRSLHADAWAIAPEAYKGITVSGFPGFFMIFGPNTNFLSVLAIMEPQIEFIVRGTRLALLEGRVFEPRTERQDAYNVWIQDCLSQSAFSSGCQSYYVHPSGRITSNWWGTVEDYAALLTKIDEDEYVFSTISEKVETS